MRFILAALIAATAGQAFADTCYRRVYSHYHLAKNPAQSVMILEMRFTEGAENHQAFARVVFKDSSKLWTNGLYCWNEKPADDPGATMRCGVECDGGTFTVRPKGESIFLTTLGGSCPDGEEIPLRSVTDEGAAKTVYRLDKVKLESCF